MEQSKTPANDNCIIAIYSEDKKGLLNQVLVLFNRRDHYINSLNVSRTDIQGLVLITLEVSLPLNELQTQLRKLEKIIEVYQAIAYLPGEIELNKVAFYRVSSKIMSDSLWLLLHNYGAVVTNMFDDSFIIQKTGTDRAVSELYNQLDGEHLLSFCKSSMIAEKSMVQLDKYFDAVG